MKFHKNGVYIKNGTLLAAEDAARSGLDHAEDAKRGTITYGILQSHNVSGDPENLKIYFDAMASHDITYVGIIQTARASGMEKFPIPYVLTNCHNSLCAVGGTINEDDHVFGLSAAKKYGGEFVPAHQAVIHSYMRERYAGGGKMIIGSDSHTRYGAYGTISVGEGGPELARQLLRRTYDIKYPPVVAVHLTGTPHPGVGPQDVAIALIGSVFKNGFVKNSVLEFVGPGIKNLSIEYRCGIDVMTTETACLSSVWATDGTVKRALESYGREDDYRELIPGDGAYYDRGIEIDLSEIEPMIALPFHPSNAFTIREFKENMSDILASIDAEVVEKLSLKAQPESLLSKIQNGKFVVDQGVIAGCSGGTYQNLMRAAELLRGRKTGSGTFWLSCYPGSMPVMQALTKNGAIADLMSAGASVRSCFCGPCFGAGDVPANGAFSIRHTTRNFPNREGSRPADGQASYVALMDARSIAATALNGGVLTAATELDFIPADAPDELCEYDDSSYKARVYYGVGTPDSSAELVFGPNITDWPAQIAMPENLVLSVAAAIYDPVTTTDELIPSGETSSYRSNPLRLAEFTLSRKVPEYVGRAKDTQKLETLRRAGNISSEVGEALMGFDAKSTGIGTLVLAMRPGDGSAREQAASCQRVLGGCANIAQEYATKRYRSNVVNWGMLPFILPELESYGIKAGDRILIPGIRTLLEGSGETLSATLVQGDKHREITLSLPGLTREERDIILAGCLINFYA